MQLPSQPGSSWYYEFDVVPCQLKGLILLSSLVSISPRYFIKVLFTNFVADMIIFTEVIERMMLHISSKQADDLPCTQGKPAKLYISIFKQGELSTLIQYFQVKK